MDNLSHSVAGLAAGELIHRSLAQESDSYDQRIRRRLLLLTCWLASNFPDLDLFLTPLLPEPLGYLLHHRGHTHTVLFVLPQALLLATLVWLCWPGARRLLQASTIARKGFLLAIFTGFGLHLAMDYLNPYGIHPFYPVDSRWFYGDMVFILEPFFWIAFGVPLAIAIGRRWLRWLLLGALVGVPLYFTMQAYLAWASFGLLAASAAAIGLVQRQAGNNGRAGLMFAGLLAVVFVGVQASASQQARHKVEVALLEREPAARVLDVSLSPFPSNPFCWSFVSVQNNEGAGVYRLRSGLISLAPLAVPVGACPAAMAGRTQTLAAKPAAALVFGAEHSGDLALLRRLKANNCHVEAWLRFARVPLVTEQTAMDLRFPGGPDGNFTSMRMADFEQRPCAGGIPQWEFPRADLFAPTSRTQFGVIDKK